MSSEQEPEVAAPAPEEKIEKSEAVPAEDPKEEPVEAAPSAPIDEGLTKELPAATEKVDEKTVEDEKLSPGKVDEIIEKLAAKASELEVKS